MFVTLSTLVGYTILNGSYGTHFAMLIGCIYCWWNFILYTDPEAQAIFGKAGIEQINWTRCLCMVVHSILIVINFLNGSQFFTRGWFK
jgi:hypothetical protein